jgi:hypothetical protein
MSGWDSLWERSSDDRKASATNLNGCQSTITKRMLLGVLATATWEDLHVDMQCRAYAGRFSPVEGGLHLTHVPAVDASVEGQIVEGFGATLRPAMTGEERQRASATRPSSASRACRRAEPVEGERAARCSICSPRAALDVWCVRRTVYAARGHSAR